MGGIRAAALVAAPALRPEMNPRIEPHGGDEPRTASSTWTLVRRPVLCLAGYVFVYATRPRRHADPLGRVQLLRLPAVVVPLPRHDARGGRARLLRRRVSRIHRHHPVAGHAAVGERASDRRRRHAGAVLRRRPRADAMDEPVGRRLHAVLPARRRAGRAVLDGCGLGAPPPRASPPLQRARHCRDAASTILLGTNLYHYATFDSSYSHAYSFFLFARSSISPNGGTRRATDATVSCSGSSPA